VTAIAPGALVAHITALLPSLRPSEQRVASMIVERSDEVVEMSSSELAQLVGVSRATVVRTSQALGLSGYPQLRVLIARDMVGRSDEGNVGELASTAEPVEVLRHVFRAAAASLPAAADLVAADAMLRTVDALLAAEWILIVANGMSAPVGQEAALRLRSLGLRVEAPQDSLGQQVSARLLDPASVCLILSGSGSNGISLRAAAAARAAGAVTVGVTGFARSPLVENVDVPVVLGQPGLSFRDELLNTSRVTQSLFVTAVAASLAFRLGQSSRTARSRSMEMIAENLWDSHAGS
jgi:DNA-binding MurR/RpiR family transcriptional regulator